MAIGSHAAPKEKSQRKNERHARDSAFCYRLRREGWIATAKGLLQIENGCVPRATLESGFPIRRLTHLPVKSPVQLQRLNLSSISLQRP